MLAHEISVDSITTTYKQAETNYTPRGIINKITFITAGILLILHAFYLTFNIHVKKPSLMHVIHEEGVPKTLVKKTERFLIVFFCINRWSV